MNSIFVRCLPFVLAAGLASPALAQDRLEIMTLPAGSVAHGAASGIAGVVSGRLPH